MEPTTVFEPLWTVQAVARTSRRQQVLVYHRSEQGLVPSVPVPAAFGSDSTRSPHSSLFFERV
jgi:hypothetical protein